MNTLAHESEAIRAWKFGDKRAMRELMASYEPLINARAYSAHKLNRDIALDDFKQAAWEGFIRACKYFDPSRGPRVAILAELCIKNEIEALLLSKRVTTASNTPRMRALFNRLPREARARGYDISRLSDAEKIDLAGVFMCSKEQIASAAEVITAQTTELDAPDIPPVKEKQLERVAENKRRRHIESRLAMLPERERLIVELNILREPKVTLEKIGEMVCLTKERTRQLRDVGLWRMRAYFDERGIGCSDLSAECG